VQKTKAGRPPKTWADGVARRKLSVSAYATEGDLLAVRSYLAARGETLADGVTQWLAETARQARERGFRSLGTRQPDVAAGRQRRGRRPEEGTS
jgi:hypothetical protein